MYYYYYQPYEQFQDSRQQQPLPGFFPPGQNLERRVTRLERTVEGQRQEIAQLRRTVERHTDRLNRLNRRLRRVEQQFGFAMTSDDF